MTDGHAAKPQPTRTDLRNFGLTFAGVALVVAAVLRYRGRDTAQIAAIVSAAFAIIAFVLPALLKPFFGPWMKFAEVLGAINTKILLGIFFFIGLTPVSFMLKAMGRDPMNRRFKDRKAPSYWSAPPSHQDGTRHFDRQF